MILEKNLDGKILYDNIVSIIDDKKKLEAMGKAAGSLADEDASDKILDLVLELVGNDAK